MFNLAKRYNDLLDVNSMNPGQRKESLLGVFDRDIRNNANFKLLGKPIYPTPKKNGNVALDTLFKHLTTEVVDKITRKREYERHRSMRLHWIKHHISMPKEENGIYVFSTRSRKGSRTYVFDKIENYVIVLEPLRSGDAYYLLTAYPPMGVNENQIHNAYKRRYPRIL